MLLKRLRRIILQDSALMQLQNPYHHVFQDPLFQTEIFKAYALQVLKANNNPETPMDLQLQQVMPRMVERLDVARDPLDGRLTEFQATFSQDLCTLAKGIEDFASHMDDERQRDREMLGQALSNIAGGISMMSMAVMETRMVFPGIEGDFTVTPKTPPATAMISGSSPPSPVTERSCKETRQLQA